MGPMTAADKVRALRRRRAAAGLVEVRMWVHPGDREAIKRYAEQLQKRRQKPPDKA